MEKDLEKLSDVVKLSAHVTRLLGQNPGLMTLQGTNSYILQPPSSTTAPLILIDTSSPHTAQQYVDLLFTHLYSLGLQSGMRETHFEGVYQEKRLKNLPEEKVQMYKAGVIAERKVDPQINELRLEDYGPHGQWVNTNAKERKLPVVEHIILTHRHLDHVGALPHLLKTLKKHGCPPPKLWKLPSPDETVLQASERDRLTTDAALWNSLPEGTYHGLNPFQPFHPIMPGLMISIIDPAYRHLLKYDKDGKPRWNDVPEVARVSVRCLKTPGHTADSISLVLCEGEKGVFTGDTVLGQGTAIFTDLSAYMTSLKTLLSLRPNVLYPAHGPHIASAEAAKAMIEQYLSHRQQREDQILALLVKIAQNPGTLGSMIKECMDKLNAAKKKAGKPKIGGLSWNKVGSGENELPKGQGIPAAIWSKDSISQIANGDQVSQIQGEGDVEEEKEDSVVVYEASASHPGGLRYRRHAKEDHSDKEEGDDSKEPKPDPYEIFPGPEDEFSKVISIPLICRLIYKTLNEKIIFAASKSVLAHLEKLEKDGKVKKGIVKLPNVIDGVVGPAEEIEGWEVVNVEGLEAVGETGQGKEQVENGNAI